MTRTIHVPQRPRGIEFSPDGNQLFVALSDPQKNVQTSGDGIVSIDVASGRINGIYPSGSDPERFAITPDGKRLYAANEDGSWASATEIASKRVIATLIVGIEPEGVAITPDGRWVYVTAETSNSVSVIDVKANKVVANFLVDVRPRAVAFGRNIGADPVSCKPTRSIQASKRSTASACSGTRRSLPPLPRISSTR